MLALLNKSYAIFFKTTRRKFMNSKTHSPEDIKHYCKTATALSETIEIQKEIDRLYQEVELSLG